MTRLFIRFYAGVLIVLFLAWYIHGAVLERRQEAENARIHVAAHGGGARLVARELNVAPAAEREQVLGRLRKRFEYPVEVIPLGDLPSVVQRQIAGGDDVAHCRLEKRNCVVAVLSGGTDVVRLGPFPDYGLKEAENSLGGWMRLTAEMIDSTPASDRQAVLDDLRERFDFPVDIADREDLPDWPRGRLAGGETVVLYPHDPEQNDRWSAATPLSEGTRVIRFGPFPAFERVEEKAATTTLALVLLPAALAIALLLRPVARQLRHVENAAEAIAAGDLSTRVDERRTRSAKPLAHAFNHMASRTESLVRTQRELLQAVSHELRTPLSRMRFAIELIDTAQDEAERRQRLESLDAATEELDELVGELLSYVRMETTGPKLNRERFALRHTLQVVISKYVALHPAIQFEVSDNVGEEDAVVADRSAFQRAVGNMLSNAGRFANSRVTISASAADGDTVVDIDDDGCGIPESERQHVFEPFMRLTETANGHGVGLGLALVKRIMAQHGGSVVVMNAPLGGCRIRTTWPGDEISAKG